MDLLKMFQGCHCSGATICPFCQGLVVLGIAGLVLLWLIVRKRKNFLSKRQR